MIQFLFLFIITAIEITALILIYLAHKNALGIIRDLTVIKPVVQKDISEAPQGEETKIEYRYEDINPSWEFDEWIEQNGLPMTSGWGVPNSDQQP